MTATEATDGIARLYRVKPGTVALIEVPTLRFLMIDGAGGPTDAEFAGAVQALYTISYALRFAAKAASEVYKVAPLEALWWADDPDALATVAAMRNGEGGWTEADKQRWKWTAMIMQPEPVTDALVATVMPAAIARKGLAAGPRVRFEAFTEGLAAQVMHVGPYADEPATIALLHRYIDRHGYQPVGRHHEIYLGDPRRSAPQRLRTILRQPIAPAGSD
jgi:hypothetical protein